MQRLVDGVERVAALFLAVIVLLTVSTVVLRSTISWQIPDWFQFACIAQAIAIFWGLASATYRNNHIMVDVLWEWLGPVGRRRLDIFAGLVCLAFLAVLTWMLVSKVGSAQRLNDQTTDLRLPVWPFYLVAMLGVAMATLLSVLRLYLLFIGRDPGGQRPQQLD